jgi:biopolymer transport protein ExbD
MTPMVDLMSLLITFFMLTTAFSKPKIMEIVLPEKDVVEDTTKGPEIEAKRTLNLLLSEDDKVYYYIGKPPMNDKDVEVSSGKLVKSDYGKDGIRKIVLKMNMLLYEKVDSATQDVISGKTKISQDSLLVLIKGFKKQDKKGPIVMIKADKNAKYRNIVDVIDEMAICNVARYAIVDINEYELKMLEAAPK